MYMDFSSVGSKVGRVGPVRQPLWSPDPPCGLADTSVVVKKQEKHTLNHFQLLDEMYVFSLLLNFSVHGLMDPQSKEKPHQHFLTLGNSGIRPYTKGGGTMWKWNGGRRTHARSPDPLRSALLHCHLTCKETHQGLISNFDSTI